MPRAQEQFTEWMRERIPTLADDHLASFIDCQDIDPRIAEIVPLIEAEQAKREKERAERNWTVKEFDGVRVVRWIRADGEGSWDMYVLLPGHLSDSDVWEQCANAGMDPGYRYSYPGGPFHHEAWIDRTKTRVLVRQHGGLDI